MHIFLLLSYSGIRSEKWVSCTEQPLFTYFTLRFIPGGSGVSTDPGAGASMGSSCFRLGEPSVSDSSRAGVAGGSSCFLVGEVGSFLLGIAIRKPGLLIANWEIVFICLIFIQHKNSQRVDWFNIESGKCPANGKTSETSVPLFISDRISIFPPKRSTMRFTKERPTPVP